MSGDEKHVIDSNSLMEKRMEELEVLRRAGGQQPEEGYEGGDAEGFMGGLGAEAVDALLSDRDGGSGIIKAAGRAGSGSGRDQGTGTADDRRCAGAH